MVAVFVIFLLFVSYSASGQVSEPGPQLPIVLEYSDSLLGGSQAGASTREFIGHVRFSQGNVTVTCDKAIHDASQNKARLYGNVVVKQGSTTLSCPYLVFDGNANMGYAENGMTVIDGNTKLSAKRGRYSTKTHDAWFTDSVKASDDTSTLWADRATYNRDTKIRQASGRVVVYDSTENAWMRADSVFHDPSTSYFNLLGNAAIWQCKSDTMVLIADSIVANQQQNSEYSALGNVELVRGHVAARADSIHYDEQTGLIQLYRDPALWSDSMLFFADTLLVNAPDRKLKTITGFQHAMMVSRSDSARPDRYDQVSGSTVVLNVDSDTVRKLTAVTNAQSITWRLEEDEPQGLAKFASDTIKAMFGGGKPEDIYWLGAVQGEHHPENIASNNVASYLLPGFVWRPDRPLMRPLPTPYSEPPIRTQPFAMPKGPDVSTGKKE